MKKILIVGAGFAGCTIARILADKGMKISLIEKRNHIGGNSYDYINDKNERIHKYGPHLFHCNKSDPALKFLNRFTKWVDYKHKVRALLSSNKTTPLPINRTTLEDVFKISLNNNEETINLLNNLKVDIPNPKNSEELFLSSVGEKITSIFFRPYTEKMWGLKASELEVSIGARLPLRTDRNDLYFNDSFQALPVNGYTGIFKEMVNHKNINLKLGLPFNKGMEKDFDYSFLSTPIDEYFDYCFGHLPYRSILFENKEIDYSQEATTINFTDNGKYTRSTQWSLLPNSPSNNNNKNTTTLEIPCSIEENKGEYYYPVKTKKSKKIYELYKQKSKKCKNITFIGRVGLFMYIDMAPAINIHIKIANDFLKKHKI